MTEKAFPRRPTPTNEREIAEQENNAGQQRDSLPQHPHPSEPQETRAQHATEQVIGHEIRPANPYNRFTAMSHRQIPPHMMRCTVPTCTNAGRMLNKPAPKSMSTAPKRRLPDMRFDVRVTAPAGSRFDPFKGMGDSSVKKRKRIKWGF